MPLIQRVTRAAGTALKTGATLAKVWQPTSQLSGEPLFKRVFNYQIARRTGLPIGKGKSLPATTYFVNQLTLQKLGIHPNLTRNTIQAHVLSIQDYATYCQKFRKDPQKLKGVACPKGKEVREIFQQKRLSPSPENRVLIIPENAEAITLAHEILHIIFLDLNESDPHAYRRFFARLALQEARIALIRDPLSPYSKFYLEIAASCAHPFPLQEKLEQNEASKTFFLEAFEFIGEVFAYGGTLAIGYQETDSWKISNELEIFLKRSLQSTNKTL